LRESLRLIEEEGLQDIFEHHRRIAHASRAGVRAMGPQLLASDEDASTGVTPVFTHEGVPDDDFRSRLRQKFGVTLAGGQKELEGKILRIGHLGHVNPADIILTISAIEFVLKELGHPVEIGSTVGAAEEILAK
jgi:aspartate aminotransferase-like enzyme